MVPYLYRSRYRRYRGTGTVVPQKNLFNINLKRLGMVGSFRDEVESRALTAYDHSDWVNAPSARSWHLYHVFHGQIDFGGAETAYYSSQTM